MVLLDTDPMTVLEREGPEAEVLKARLDNIPLDDLGTTILSYEEQTRGWLAYIARLQTEAARVRAYALLNRHLEIYCRVVVVPYDHMAAEEYERLRHAKIRIGTMGVKIAAIALANNATLPTRNLSDFAKIPGLRVEDWSV